MTNLIVEYTVGASAELEDNYRWIKERSEISAEKWLNDLIHEIEALSQHPLKHSIAPESPKFPVEIRLMLYRKRRGQFRIYYTVEPKRVVILSVRRSSRKPLGEEDLKM